MPRDGSGVYNVPSGTYGVEDTTIDSTRYNAFVDDVAQDLNHPRPILAGGTGATNATAALIALGAEEALQVIANYDSDTFLAGSFYSLSSATAPPVVGHAFAGICYLTDANNMFIEAADQDEGVQPGRKYIRQKRAGVWSPWGLTAVLGSAAGDMFFGITGTTPNSQFVVNDKANASGNNILVARKSDGRVFGNGLHPPGAIVDFATANAPTGWLTCDGQSVATATYPDLFAATGYMWGGSGANFNVPNFLSRYRRHRDNSTLAGAVGTMQNPANKAHSHRILGTSGAADRSLDHLHRVTGGTGSMNRSNPHNHGVSGGVYGGTTTNGRPQNFAFDTTAPITAAAISINNTDINHEHGIDFYSQGFDRGIDHLHAMDFTSQGGSGDDANESRPYSATVLTCIKT